MNQIKIKSSLGLIRTALFVLPLLMSICPSAIGQDTQSERLFNFSSLEVDLDSSGEWIQLTLPDGLFDAQEGEPAIPSVSVRLPIEQGVRAVSARLEVISQVERNLPLPVMPFTIHQPEDTNIIVPGAPDPSVYARDDMMPSQQALLKKTTTMSSGAKMAIVQINPVQYNPVTQKLICVREARLVVQLEAGDERTERVLEPKRTALMSRQEAIEKQGDRGTVLLMDHGFAPSKAPSTSGSMVEYVIISPPDEEMEAEWQRLADWKTESGHPALVVTTDWIANEYSYGVDLPEQIRYFLRDAYLHWGLKRALLGGDVNLVPTRYVGWYVGRIYPSDFYYMCLEGTWDSNGNGRFVETAALEYRTADFDQEIQVGRISAKNATQISDWLEKYFTYVKTPALDGYLDRGLMLGEVLFSSEWSLTGWQGTHDCDDCNMTNCRYIPVGENLAKVCVSTDGAEHCMQVADMMWNARGDGQPDVKFIFERSYLHGPAYPDLDIEGPLSSMATVDAINYGYHSVFHLGHASKDRWAVGTGRLLVNQLSDLTNGDDNHFSFIIGADCSSAAINYDSIGEAFVMLPDHGGLSYIGATKSAMAGAGRDFSRFFYSALYTGKGNTIGDGYMGATDLYVGTDQLVYTRALIGDPGMMVWWETPTPMTVSFDQSPPIGASVLPVTVTDEDTDPVVGAYVCVYKDEDVYTMGYTGDDGIVEMPFWAGSAGDFKVTVTAYNHMPVIQTGTVDSQPDDPALIVTNLNIVDDGQNGSIGNGNGLIELGETIRLSLEMHNAGGDASNVSVTLALGDEAPIDLIEVTDDAADLLNISADGTVFSNSAFLFEVTGIPTAEIFGDADQVQVPFDLKLTYNPAVTVTQTILMAVSRPRLDVGLNRQEDFTTTQGKIWFGIANIGKGSASNLRLAVASSAHDEEILFVSPEEMDLDEIAPGDTVYAGPFDVGFLGVDGAELQLQVTDTFLETTPILHSRLVGLTGPMAPDSVNAVGYPDGVSLRWQLAEGEDAEDVYGYKVYRAPEVGGVFEPTHPGIQKEHTYSSDSGLAGLTTYRYQVRAMDAGGNLGPISNIVTVSTSPPVSLGWPNEPGTASYASPNICETDRLTTPYGGRNMREIFFAGEKVFGFHGDGNEISDGDNVGSTTGIFSRSGSEFRCKMAVGDLDGGEGNWPEIVGLDFKSKHLICWDNFGRTPLWEISPPYGTAWNTPVIVDLDQDGQAEVALVAGSNGHQGVYAYSHDGSPFLQSSTDGKLVDLGEGWCYNSLAVGDIDGNETPDFVLAGRNSRLHVVNGTTGTYLNGFQGGIALDSPCRSSASIAEVNGYPGNELFVATSQSLYCYMEGGAQVWKYVFETPYPMSSSWDLCSEPAIGDVNNDGKLDVVIVDGGNKLIALTARNKTMLSNFPVQLESGFHYGSCILANIDSDPRPEIIFGDGDSRIHAYTYRGELAAGFPIYYTGNLASTSLAAWDVDDDGYQNLVVSSNGVSNMTVFDMSNSPFVPSQNPWPQRRCNNRNTGFYSAEAPPVGIQIVLDDAMVDNQGFVTLVWYSSENGLRYQVIRRPEDNPAASQVVAEVPVSSNPGTVRYEITDQPAETGRYIYDIVLIGQDGQSEAGPTTTVDVDRINPFVLSFRSIGPQPIVGNRGCRISFTLPGAGSSEIAASMRLFDLQGRQVGVVMDELFTPGEQSIEWDGRDQSGRLLETGVYLIRLDTLGRSVHERVMLIQ